MAIIRLHHHQVLGAAIWMDSAFFISHSPHREQQSSNRRERERRRKNDLNNFISSANYSYFARWPSGGQPTEDINRIDSLFSGLINCIIGCAAPQIRTGENGGQSKRPMNLIWKLSSVVEMRLKLSDVKMFGIVRIKFTSAAPNARKKKRKRSGAAAAANEWIEAQKECTLVYNFLLHGTRCSSTSKLYYTMFFLLRAARSLADMCECHAQNDGIVYQPKAPLVCRCEFILKRRD